MIVGDSIDHIQLHVHRDIPVLFRCLGFAHNIWIHIDFVKNA